MIFWRLGCRIFGHEWSYDRDACDRCWITGTEFYSHGR